MICIVDPNLASLSFQDLAPSNREGCFYQILLAMRNDHRKSCMLAMVNLVLCPVHMPFFIQLILPFVPFWFPLQVFVVAVLAIFPIIPRNLSNRAYRLSFMGTACSSLYSLYSLYGVNLLYSFHHLCDHLFILDVMLLSFFY